MSGDAQKFIDCLQEAEQLLEDFPRDGYVGVDHALSFKVPESFDLAIFEKWSEFFETDVQKKPPIRLIQHLSSTGGTLISKCLAGLPNVVLLGEVNPLSELQQKSSPQRFAPSDLAFLAKRAKLPHSNEFIKDIFKAEIEVIAKQARLYGKYLVLREHSHSDFLVGETTNKFSAIREFLKEDFPILSVLTVRHPIDSYLSMLKSKWLHFTPQTFDEYCRRYMLFIDSNEDIPIYKYEDFVNAPAIEMKTLCQSLELPFNEAFLDVFDINVLSGDSGRSSNVIEKRERRKFDDEFQKLLNESLSYQALCERLGYASSIEASA